MVKRLFDLFAATIALFVLSPLMLLAAIGICLSSPGPILYRAPRVGKGGTLFTMYKFRTMHVAAKSTAKVITAHIDPRVFTWGKWLRILKIDELPQLVNIIKGEMSVVGPRPEDPQIVQKYYTPLHMETLTVTPGLASPGSVYNYTCGERLIGETNPEKDYVEKLLPVKLALDLVYIRERTFWYDLEIVGRTLYTILMIGIGWRDFSEPPEMKRALGLIVPARRG